MAVSVTVVVVLAVVIFVAIVAVVWFALYIARKSRARKRAYRGLLNTAIDARRPQRGGADMEQIADRTDGSTAARHGRWDPGLQRGDADADPRLALLQSGGDSHWAAPIGSDAMDRPRPRAATANEQFRSPVHLFQASGRGGITAQPLLARGADEPMRDAALLEPARRLELLDPGWSAARRGLMLMAARRPGGVDPHHWCAAVE